jgi:hypothetical protein
VVGPGLPPTGLGDAGVGLGIGADHHAGLSGEGEAAAGALRQTCSSGPAQGGGGAGGATAPGPKKSGAPAGGVSSVVVLAHLRKKIRLRKLGRPAIGPVIIVSWTLTRRSLEADRFANRPPSSPVCRLDPVSSSLDSTSLCLISCRRDGLELLVLQRTNAVHLIPLDSKEGVPIY